MERLGAVAVASPVFAAAMLIRLRNRNKCRPNHESCHFAVIAPRSEDFTHLLEAFNSTTAPQKPTGPLEMATVSVDGHRILIINTGSTGGGEGEDLVGAEAAILATQYALESFKVKLVIHCGLCGALRERGELILGDVITAWPSVFFFDRRMAVFGEESRLSGILETEVWEPVKHIADSMHLKTAKIGSGNSFDAESTGLDWLEQNGAAAKDMESCAIGWTASM